MIVYFKDQPVRVEEIDGEWWFVLKDVCDVVGIRNPRDAAERIFPEFMIKDSVASTDTMSYHEHQTMLLTNERGVYQCLMNSRKLEARQFQMWVFDILSSLRRGYGLQSFEAFRMTDEDVQNDIYEAMNDWYYDDSREEVVRFDSMAGVH